MINTNKYPFFLAHHETGEGKNRENLPLVVPSLPLKGQPGGNRNFSTGALPQTPALAGGNRNSHKGCPASRMVIRVTASMVRGSIFSRWSKISTPGCAAIDSAPAPVAI